MRESIDNRAKRAISERAFPGCVIGVSRAGKRTVQAFGGLTYDGPPAAFDIIYDLASVTKSIPLASLAALLASEGKLSHDERVAAYLPELRNDYGATIGDLLRYRVSGIALSRLRMSTFEEIRTRALERGFDGPPGQERYSNLPAFILGLIVERVSGESIAALANRHFFEPLGMCDTTYFPHDRERVAPAEIDFRGEVRALPHDESAYLFANARRSVGHAGVFSTADDLLAFCEALISGRLERVARAAQSGLGWSVNEPFFMGSYAGAKAFGKTGFTGTSVLCDIDREIALVILSNRCYPSRPSDAASRDSAINVFRRDIADLVFQSG